MGNFSGEKLSYRENGVGTVEAYMRFLAIFLGLFCLTLSPAWAKDDRCACDQACTCSKEKIGPSIEGRIAPAGPSIYMEGSHELLDRSGKVIARLSGLKANFDLSAHEGQWVKVLGDWRPTVEAGGKIFEVTGVTAPESPPSSNP